MEDLSLHILDLVDNSLRAGAENVLIRLTKKQAERMLVLEIHDDGPGMDEDALQQAVSPFFTTKNDKKYGIGLSLLAQAAKATEGQMQIETAPNFGFKITATFYSEHPDMKPVGDIEKTLTVLRFSHPEVNFVFECITV
jgi:signal transduction histidine kinase